MLEMPGNIGLPEIAIVLIIALIVFGPKRLPELGRSLGKGIREFKGSVSGDNDDDDDERKALSPSQAPAAPVEPARVDPAPVEPAPAEPAEAEVPAPDKRG
jgi:sec-independent protein translocase protein TatA